MPVLTTTLFTELLHDVGHARIEVTGSSMLPAILPGDILQVQSSPAQVGDVVVFNRDGHLCAHRLLAVIDGQAVARGDAVRKLDLSFPVGQILGRVTSLERAGHTIHDFRFRPWASFFLRNSSLLRRVFLRLLAIHNFSQHGQEELEPVASPSKSRA